MSVLEVQDLSVTLFTRGGALPAVDGFSLSLQAGETVALVGESGCGKSLTGLALMRLLPEPPARIVGGSIRLDGQNLVPLSQVEMRRRRGRDIAMIFQDPMTALNPVVPIGAQLTEALRSSGDLTRAAARARAIELLEQVGIPDPSRRLADYPHQLSGGMSQRVLIAMAIAHTPKVLIADEPTTALDVTIQAQILALLKSLQRKFGMAVLFITHDLGVVAEIADRVVVMYAGRKVEEATVDDLFDNSRHPYTQGLLRATISADQDRRMRLAPIDGVVPNLDALPAGCAFANRCPRAFARCHEARPRLIEGPQGHAVACFASEREGRADVALVGA